MSIDPTALSNLLADEAAGKKIAVAQILKVIWDASHIKYYAGSGLQTPPFIGSGFSIEPRLILPEKDPFFQFEICPDLRTDTIKVSFDDIDKDITDHFQTYKSGVRGDIIFYYPAYNILATMWFGQLVAPSIYGWSRIDTVLTNGYRSAESLLPGRPPQPDFCTANFGGLLPSFAAVGSNGCRYDRQLGGNLGEYITGTTAFADCPKRKADCNLRFNTTDARYWLGFQVDASAVASDGHTGYLAVSKGNETALKEPIRVIAGTKHVRGLQAILGRQEDNPGDHAHGWFRAVYLIGEGPVKQILNFFVKDKFIEQSNLEIRFGTIAQIRTNYAPDVSNYSLTAHASAAYGWIDARTASVKDFNAECDVVGYEDVYVATDIEAGEGLIGKYYNDQTTTNEIARIVSPTINFPSNSQPPLVTQRLEIGFKIVWAGFITFPATETVTFTTPLNDDNVIVKINNTTVIASTTYPSTGSGTFAATADTTYPIEITFTNFGAAPGAFNPWGLILKWASTSIGAAVVIPSSALSHDADLGYQRQWTDDRVWWLLESYTNQRWGMANDLAKFNIAEVKTTSLWGRNTIEYTHTFPDGETITYTGQRASFNAIMEGRVYADQITDICRSAHLAVPFQNDDSYTIRPIRAFTSDELTNARVFTDRGQSKNIIWDRVPQISLSQVPDDKVVNTIKVSFEDKANKDVERQIIVDDPQQKLLAGRALGDGMLKEVTKNFSAYGVVDLQEALRFGQRLLKFGEFDEGGSQNNLRADLTAPMELFLGLARYDCIKLDTELLDGFTIGTGDTTETPQYFRLLHIQKIAGGKVKATAQVYNQTAYEAFETVTATPDPGDPPDPTPPVPPDPIPGPCLPEIADITYDPATGLMDIEPLPC